jgi:hypothetical protein
MRKLIVVMLSGVCLVGCGAQDLGGDGVASLMEQDFGGPGGLMDFFESHTEEQIRWALAAYGVGFTNPAPTGITECPQFFPASDRNTWHSLNGMYHFIDSSGRPHRAYAYLPPINAAARSETCQTNVGRWGDAADPNNDYDGGHLIGSQLGGWGGRANLIPQDANFNRGNWVVLENKMAKCAVLPDRRVRYYIGANYPDISSIVPNVLLMELRNQSTGASVSLSFTNTDGGGPNGVTEKNRGVNFLTSAGCN